MASRRSGDDIREAVYDAATDAFATKGLAATTMDDLVQVTGIARATIYRHAGNKEEVLLAVLLREIDGVMTTLGRRAAKWTDVAELIVEGTLGTIELVADNPLLRSVVAGASAFGDEVSDDAMTGFAEHLERLIDPIFTTFADDLRPELTRSEAGELLLRTIVSHLTVGGRQRRTKAQRRAYLQRTLAPVFVPDDRR